LRWRAVTGVADDACMAQPVTARTRSTPEQRGWYVYDWANTRVTFKDRDEGL
jgi:hypothetical protein